MGCADSGACRPTGRDAGTLAQRADKLALYEDAVQSCANEIRYLEKFFREAVPALRYARCAAPTAVPTAERPPGGGGGGGGGANGGSHG